MIEARWLEALEKTLGADHVHHSDERKQARRHDYWVLNNLRSWRGESLSMPGVIVTPESVEQVQAVVRWAAESKTPMVPFGLGSGVCGGIEPNENQVLIDLGRLNRVREIDGTNLIASFDAGCNGLEAEEAVAAKGLTIGHWPQSIAISSVGGWVSTRAAGQFSTAYGNIEDIIYSIEAVLPSGELVELGKAPRAAAGPDLRHVLLGAEGTMGVITGVSLSLRRAAEESAFTSFSVPTMGAGFEAQREIVQTGWLPPVMRQYDASEFARNFKDYAVEGQGLCLMVHEGPASRVAAELEAVREIANRCGLKEASPEIGRHWMAKRNHVPSWQQLFEANLVVDTIEVSAPWTEIEAVYQDAVGSLSEVETIRMASAHSSHVYRSGLNLYFTFAAHHEDSGDMERTYLNCWDRVMEATARHGGGIAHHHGVGRLRRPHLAKDLGAGGLELLRTLKGAVDPDGLMNPGNLIPDA